MINLNTKARDVEVINKFLLTEGHKKELITNNDVTITICVTLYSLIETDKMMIASGGVGDEERLPSDAVKSLIGDLTNMFLAADDFTDIKLKTKDNSILCANKFVLLARSEYFRKCIEDATKKENFNGTLKVDINAEPLTATLHWIYTGELNENADKVINEVVDAAKILELNQLIKMLDRTLVTYCNKDNMFHMLLLAQKNGMANAVNDIRYWINKNVEKNYSKMEMELEIANLRPVTMNGRCKYKKLKTINQSPFEKFKLIEMCKNMVYSLKNS